MGTQKKVKKTRPVMFMVCNQPGCRTLLERTTGPAYCEEHRGTKRGTLSVRKLDKERSSRRDRKFYGTSLWQKAREAALQREPICLSCNRRVATEVDHVDNNRYNLKPDNLRSLCKSCHSRKTVQQDGGFGNGRKK